MRLTANDFIRFYGTKVEAPETGVWVTCTYSQILSDLLSFPSSGKVRSGGEHHPLRNNTRRIPVVQCVICSMPDTISYPSLDTEGCLKAPATEFAYATLKEGKTKAELEAVIMELENAAKVTEKCQGFSWGYALDIEESVVLCVLGWDLVEASDLFLSFERPLMCPVSPTGKQLERVDRLKPSSTSCSWSPTSFCITPTWSTRPEACGTAQPKYCVPRVVTCAICYRNQYIQIGQLYSVNGKGDRLRMQEERWDMCFSVQQLPWSMAW